VSLETCRTGVFKI